MLGESIDQFAMMGGDLRDTTIRGMDYFTTELQREIPRQQSQSVYAKYERLEGKYIPKKSDFEPSF